MSKTTFKTNPRRLEELLQQCRDGKVQLPDFQRSWVWAEDRIQSLIASISRAFPIGALMTLESRQNGSEIFARRPVEGALHTAKDRHPDELLLDGQQRMTSLYQTCLRGTVVKTITPKNKVVHRWFYIDICKALEPGADREEAIFAVPEDRKLKKNFDKEIVLDLSTREKEIEQMMFPLNCVFDWDEWQEQFWDFWTGRDSTKKELFKEFKKDVLANFGEYHVPVIALANDTSHEAVCLVFEKVNTGGKALDAFELLTAMYAARGHKLRDDWLGKSEKTAEGTFKEILGLQARLTSYGTVSGQDAGVLSKVASTDFLQAIALLHTKEVRLTKIAAGVKENDLPAVRGTRQSLLDLPLEAYLKYRDAVEAGFKRTAKFLREQNIYRVNDLPYQTQLVPLAAIFAELGDTADHATHRSRIERWYWCGVFGELYGSAVESRFAKDIVEVPAWLAGGPEPTTVTDGRFRADRLYTMRTRLSAAYKGIHALLMRKGARDFLTGQTFDTAVFFGEAVDIHHLFPEAWCKERKIEPKVYDTVINKTPLGYRTNRVIGGVAPSKYLARLESGETKSSGQVIPPIPATVLDACLESHCADHALLRADDFPAFMEARRKSLLTLIEEATGHRVGVAATDPAADGEEPDTQLAHDLEPRAE